MIFIDHKSDGTTDVVKLRNNHIYRTTCTHKHTQNQQINNNQMRLCIDGIEEIT